MSINGYTPDKHKELTKQIRQCKCMPLGDTPYCDKCQKAVIDFLNKYKAGNLTRDMEI